MDAPAAMESLPASVPPPWRKKLPLRTLTVPGISLLKKAVLPWKLDVPPETWNRPKLLKLALPGVLLARPAMTRFQVPEPSLLMTELLNSCTPPVSVTVPKLLNVQVVSRLPAVMVEFPSALTKPVPVMRPPPHWNEVERPRMRAPAPLSVPPRGSVKPVAEI